MNMTPLSSLPAWETPGRDVEGQPFPSSCAPSSCAPPMFAEAHQMCSLPQPHEDCHQQPCALPPTSIHMQLPPRFSTFLFQTAANSTRGFYQHFPNTNSPSGGIHLEQQILSQVPCSDPSVLSDLIIHSSINAVMAPVIPAQQDGASRMVSSAGLAGKPLLLFVQQRDFFLP